VRSCSCGQCTAYLTPVKHALHSFSSCATIIPLRAHSNFRPIVSGIRRCLNRLRLAETMDQTLSQVSQATLLDTPERRSGSLENRTAVETPDRYDHYHRRRAEQDSKNGEELPKTVARPKYRAETLDRPVD
jgi:hypothetical protein